MRLLNIALFSSVLLLAGTTLPTLAGTAGVTAAVNPEARGTPPGGAVRTIVLGDNILTDEKIDTGPGGLVQVLLADGTTFTVGPNSSLTIDKFVYDPNANTAQVTASLARGVFRFIGGRTSKTEGGVEINTPVGTVGIRGAVADISLTPNGQELKAQIDLLFGKEVTLTGPGGLLERIYKAGYSIIIGQDGRPKLLKTPPGAAGGIQQALAGKPGTHGGTGNPPTDDAVGNSDVPGDNSDKTPHDNAPPDFTPPDLDAILLATIDFFDTHENAKDILGTDNPGGFGAGYVTVPIGDEGNWTVAVRNTDPADVQIGFVPNTALLSGTAPFYETDVSLLLAFDDPQTATITVGEHHQSAASVVITPGTQLLCAACDFIKWGSWETNFQGGEGEGGISASAAGTYVTGDITTQTQYATRTGSATYYGSAQGYVVNEDLHPDGVTPHPASGDMTMHWNFGSRDGDLSIAGFDDEYDLHATLHAGATATPVFIGTGSVTGPVDENVDKDQFGSTFDVTGTFVNGSHAAAGVIGNFSATYDEGEWAATGIFGGSDTPPPAPH